MTVNDVLSSEAGKLVRQLVRYNTVSTQSNGDCADFIASRLKRGGARIQPFEETIEGVRKVQFVAAAGPPTSGGLMICAHTDVVPFADQPGWTSDPLTLTLDGDRLVARGIADMKGFLANCLDVWREISFKELKRPLILVLTCDEESVCQGSARLAAVLKNLLGPYPLPAAAWFGEPSDFITYHAHKGYGVFTLTIRGRGGHSSRPDLGLNAIALMGEVLRLIQTLNMEYRARPSREARELFPDHPEESINPAVIAGGRSPNMIADECRLTISYRCLPGTPPDAIYQSLQTRLERMFASARYQSCATVPDIHFSSLISAPAMASPPAGRLPETLVAATGQPAAGGAPYVTDAGHIAPLGIPCYICGPGHLSAAHQVNEYLPVSHFLKTRDVLLHVIRRLCMS